MMRTMVSDPVVVIFHYLMTSSLYMSSSWSRERKNQESTQRYNHGFLIDRTSEKDWRFWVNAVGPYGYSRRVATNRWIVQVRSSMLYDAGSMSIRCYPMGRFNHIWSKLMAIMAIGQICWDLGALWTQSSISFINLQNRVQELHKTLIGRQFPV
jgi:hypothetical protein